MKDAQSFLEIEKFSKLVTNLTFSFIFLAPVIRKKPDRGLKLNVLTQNGYIYNRMKDASDRIYWKCALSITNKCTAVFSTNKMLRVIDNQKNKHSHDKSAYEALKRSIQQTRKH